MNSHNLASNTIGMTVRLDDDGMPVVDTFSNFSKDLPDDTRSYLELMLSGLEFSAYSGGSFLASIGNVITLLESHENEVAFEPDDELIDAIADSKVVPINGSKKPH